MNRTCIAETQEHLSQILECTRHFFRHPELVKKLVFSSHSAQVRRMLGMNHSNQAYSYNVERHTEKYVSRRGDLLAGLYFPSASPGTLVTVRIGNQIAGEFVVQDPENEVFLPIHNENMVPMIKLAFHDVQVMIRQRQQQVEIPYYVIYILLNLPYRRWLARINMYHQHNENVYLFSSGMCHRTTVKNVTHNEEEVVFCGNTYVTYPIKDHYAIKIQKRWRFYMNNTRLQRQKWQEKMQDTNESIRLLPGIGVDYKRAEMEFYLRINDITAVY